MSQWKQQTVILINEENVFQCYQLLFCYRFFFNREKLFFLCKLSFFLILKTSKFLVNKLKMYNLNFVK